jgi:hypothetical protein
MSLFNKQIKPLEIIFTPFSEQIVASEAPPVPSASIMPSWYKKLPRFINNSQIPIYAHGKPDLKMCAPFRDVMTHGYLLVTPADIEVTRMADGTPEMYWNKTYPIQIIDSRGDTKAQENQGHGMEVPPGCDSIMFAWTAMWGMETPKGYSVLVTQPFNRYELPFVLTSGIMNSNTILDGGAYPFFLRKDFTGIIPKGTPFAQVIPIKRNNWKSKFVSPNPERNNRWIVLRDSHFHGYYNKFLNEKNTFK